jgi:aminoglycoside 3-N-acetyltransferase
MAPAFSLDSTTRDMLAAGRVFHVASTPSSGGALAEAFRRHAKARRSIHPTHSFAAIGRHAEWLTQAHHRCGTSFGRGSPMARLKEENGHVVGIGTNLGAAPFFHCLEEIEDRFPVNVFSPEPPLAARCRGYHGDEYVMSVRSHDPVSHDAGVDSAEVHGFFAEWLERHGGLEWRRVGQARAWHIPAQAMYREARRLMLRGLTIYGTAADVAKVRGDLHAPSA